MKKISLDWQLPLDASTFAVLTQKQLKQTYKSRDLMAVIVVYFDLQMGAAYHIYWSVMKTFWVAWMPTRGFACMGNPIYANPAKLLL